ncbi:BnaA01g27080D [Brassica napus]|uniref:BnaA01g27080D protein n=1 Tax=Brassica napus TaxID=3708 RepID=A0A078G0G1_BRANA|nr:BnaA01g27080D [Brassica napus]
MAFTLLSDLKAGRCSNTAEVRLLRVWEARNINKGMELMSLEMLLIDENSTVVHGTVSALLQLRFRQRMTEGSVYTLSGFDVTRSSPKYRLSDAPVAIRFNDGTEFEKLATTSRTIPTEHFRFRPYDQILGLANTGRQLPDVMGELSEIRSTITDRIPGAQRVMLNLRLGSDTTVCVSIFDSLALAFHSKLDVYGKEPRIVVVTAVNPKLVSGKLAGGTDQSGSSSKVVHAQKIEPMTVSELNQFIFTADPQIIEFLCTAKVTEIQLDEGWCYIGCSTCSKKLIREETSFTCVPCNETNAVAKLKYRVILSVSDDTGAAAFLGFDEEIASLTHVLASDAAHIVGIGTNAQVDIDLPRSLANLVGSTYTFQLRLKDFNFGPNHRSFTISRIFPARDLAPKPTFSDGGEDTDQSIPQSVATGLDVGAGIVNNGADQLTEADGARMVHEAAASGEDAGEATARKKARVE